MKNIFKVFLLLLCTSGFGYELYCNERQVLLKLRKPTYDFSLDILDRVAHVSGAHFVFSPLSTWLQLLALADGANGTTLKEILNVTRLHRFKCFREKVRDIFNYLDNELGDVAKRRSVIVVEQLLDIKDSYVIDVEKLNTAKVISLDFQNGVQSAAKANEIIQIDLNGDIVEEIDPQDFNMTVLIMSELTHLKADWRNPFNPIYTKPEQFYTNENMPFGYVNMMQQIGFYNYTDVPMINAKALELPFNNRLSMILLLPNEGNAGDLFWMLKDIRLMTIFSLFNKNGLKLINVKMPRFSQTTDVDNIAELVYDMGVQRIFYPHLAELSHMSDYDYDMHVSLMTTVAKIEVTEKGVSANLTPELLINRGDSIDFVLNRSFAYLIVDKETELIFFAGIYKNPSIY